MFQQNRLRQALYRWYSVFLFSWFAGFMITEYIELYVQCTADELKLDEICANICVVMVFTSTAVRQLVMRFNQTVNDLIQSIINGEKQSDFLDDDEVSLYMYSNF